MPSDKRERQRANRELRRAEQAREARRQRMTRFAIRGGLVVLAVIGVGVLFSVLSDDDTPATTTTSSTSTTAPNATTTTAAPQATAFDYEGFRAQPTACGAETPPPAQDLTFPEPEDQEIGADATVTATLRTSCGEIVIDLDPGAAPETVNSFVFLARSGYFDGTVSHRIVPGFVIQAGDPTATGTGGPGYAVPDEFPAEGFVYDRGVVAMANAGPGTTGSQFFLTLATTTLSNDFTAFGTITDGFETLDRIAAIPVGSREPGNPFAEVSVPLETLYIEGVDIEVN